MKNLISWAKQNILSLAQTVTLLFTAIVLTMLLHNQIKTSEVHQLNEELTQEVRTLDRDTNDIMIKMIEQRGQIMQMGATIEEANEIIQSLVGR